LGLRNWESGHGIEIEERQAVRTLLSSVSNTSLRREPLVLLVREGTSLFTIVIRRLRFCNTCISHSMIFGLDLQSIYLIGNILFRLNAGIVVRM
jgi:hypothetical protein